MACWVGMEPWLLTNDQMKILDDLGNIFFCCQFGKVITIDGFLKVTIQNPGFCISKGKMNALDLVMLAQYAAGANTETQTCPLISVILLLHFNKL